MDDPDLAVFLARLVRLDPTAVVRLRPAGAVTEVWAMLPFDVLVGRSLSVVVADDTTVGAAALLAGDPAPARRDGDWRWPLPPPGGGGAVVERLPATELVRVAAAAARVLRTALAEGVSGRAVGERALRDALLDHVPIVVSAAAGSLGERVDIPQRLVQAVIRMGFLGHMTEVTSGEQLVTVRRVAGWTILDAMYGSAGFRPISRLSVGRF